jgi:hypothetical protein
MIEYQTMEINYAKMFKGWMDTAATPPPKKKHKLWPWKEECDKDGLTKLHLK